MSVCVCEYACVGVGGACMCRGARTCVCGEGAGCSSNEA